MKESSEARLTPSLAAYLLPTLARSERNRASAARTHETAPAWPQHSGLGGRAQFPASLWPWPVHHWPRGRDASTSIVCAAYLGPEKFSSFVASLMAQTPPSCLHPPPLFNPPQSRLPPPGGRLVAVGRVNSWNSASLSRPPRTVLSSLSHEDLSLPRPLAGGFQSSRAEFR